MANPEHVTLVTKGAETIREWREANPSEQLDLSGAVLNRANLRGADLRGADLSRACLIEALLRDADLRGADLSRAILIKANLIRANLTDADLADAILTRTNLSDANLNGAQLSGAGLIEAKLEGTILSGANLGGLNLSQMNFNRMNLNKSNLTGASLDGVDLSDANLEGANLTGANLTGANLGGANLRGADLRGAGFSVANLSGADLRGTNLKHIEVYRTRFGDVDLSETIGLETIVHLGPSTVGIDTLYASKGKIPEVFLRGCGVPQGLIDFLPSLIGSAKPIDFYSCFISYSHADESFAKRLHDALQGRGIRCWKDDHMIRPGDNIYAEVNRGIRIWDKVLLCASEHSLNSQWVGREVDTAIEKEMKLSKERAKEVLAIIPLNIDGYLFQWDAPHAATLRKRLAPDFTGWEDDNAKFERQFERVVEALQTGDSGREPEPEPKL